MRAAAFPLLSVAGLVASSCGGEEHAPFFMPSGNDPESDASDETVDAAVGVSSTDASESPDASMAVDPVVEPMGCTDGPELRVLFIGNSHTYVNDVPSLVAGLACDAGTKLVTRTEAPGGVGFLEHSQSAATLGAISADAWDVVVLHDQQQRPGFRLPQVDRDGVPALRILADAISARRAEARRLLYAVWSRKEGDVLTCDSYPILCTFEGNTLAISEGYRLFAERTDSEVASVALAWAAVRADPDAPLEPASLWSNDGSHAELPGSYLAAAVLAAQILGTETADFVFAGGLDEAVARYLREVADRIVAADRDNPRVMTSELVSIACDDASVCMDTAHAAPVTLTLSSDRCADLREGNATVAGRIHTRMGHLDGIYQVVPLGGWYEVPGAAIADGTYRVHAHVDIDADGTLDAGDLDACAALTVGSGEDLAITSLTVR